MTETHLGDGSTVYINEYKWIGKNRKCIKKLSGGIGFSLLYDIYNLYVVVHIYHPEIVCLVEMPRVSSTTWHVYFRDLRVKIVFVAWDIITLV